RKRRISFSSEKLALYAVSEVAILWVTLLLVWLVIRRVRPLTLIAPALSLVAVGYMWVVSWYSPTLFDADFFYQRWAVESSAVMVLLFFLPMLVISGLSLLGFLATVIVRWVRRGKAFCPCRP
ncbi:MAG TPA: hypothetical protein VF173_05980, partial [Thermoanaerobaculia bacterium]|nr:hypothetical protein [Thermoanaerobaculia bacterium]